MTKPKSQINLGPIFGRPDVHLPGETGAAGRNSMLGEPLDRPAARIGKACESAYRRGFAQAISLYRQDLEGRRGAPTLAEVNALEDIAMKMRYTKKPIPDYGWEAIHRLRRWRERR